MNGMSEGECPRGGDHQPDVILTARGPVTVCTKCGTAL